MTNTTLFQTNLSHAVRQSNDVAFPKGTREVSILHDGPSHNIVPANATWDDFFNSPGIDLGLREQPEL
jgi:antitoxin VapB